MSKKAWLALIGLICAANLLPAGGMARAAEDVYAGVKRKLIDDGYSRPNVASLFKPAPPTMFKLVSGTMRIREGQADYSGFLRDSEIARARGFIAENRSAFRRAEQVYGVDPCVIAAILLVETRFGSYTGKTPIVAVFATFAIMDQKKNRDRVWKMLSPRDRERWGREAFDKKLLDRSSWAYEELCSLLKLMADQDVRPQSLKGSFMGAVGWPQFLPSSLVKYGADGNDDGRIDLYDSQDAISSTASYLRAHGWCQAKSAYEKEQVIWAYNHSRAYVGAILGIAEKLDRDR